MKNKFLEYYKLSDKEYELLWKDAIITIDASVILNLYRYSSSTSDEFIKLMEENKKRIWMTYQTIYEYHKNRLKVIKSQQESYNKLITLFTEEQKKIDNSLNEFIKHPLLEIEDLKRRLKNSFGRIKNFINKVKKEHPNYLENDTINLKLIDIINGNIGNNFTTNELTEIYKEGEERYSNKIPPGYCDAIVKRDKGKQSQFGDLIMWKQIINKVKEKKNNVIFVIDDRKEDWWFKFNGKTLYPQPELIKEFFIETGIRILIYQSDVFVKYAKKYLKSEFKDDAIKEIKEVRTQNEYDNMNVIRRYAQDFQLGPNNINLSGKDFYDFMSRNKSLLNNYPYSLNSLSSNNLINPFSPNNLLFDPTKPPYHPSINWFPDSDSIPHEDFEIKIMDKENDEPKVIKENKKDDDQKDNKNINLEKKKNVNGKTTDKSKSENDEQLDSKEIKEDNI